MSDFNFSMYLEDNEVHAILDAVPTVSLHPERDRLFVELLWESGARVSEAIILTQDHIGQTSVVLRNLKQKKRVTLPDGTSQWVKDSEAVKEVEVSAGLCARLNDFCEANRISGHNYVFQSNWSHTRHMNRLYAWRMVTKASEAANVIKFGKRNPTTGGRFKGAFPHSFRHSNAIKLLDETGDIMLVKQQLGHSNVRTTQIYSYVKKPKIRREVGKIKW